MSSAKITMIGYAQYFHNIGDDLFKYISLPDGIDKEILTNNILMRGGEFEVMYSDPYTMQSLIDVWNKKWYRTFDKWITALNIEYNPLENYDRMEDWTDGMGRKNNGSETVNGKVHTESERDIEDDTTTTTDVSAYDSSSYVPSNKVTVDGHNDDDLDETVTENRGTKTDFSETQNTTHKGRLHGNIGVTTSQQMLESELDLALWNLYEHITDLFLSEFVIPIYS